MGIHPQVAQLCSPPQALLLSLGRHRPGQLGSVSVRTQGLRDKPFSLLLSPALPHELIQEQCVYV